MPREIKILVWDMHINMNGFCKYYFCSVDIKISVHDQFLE